MSDIPYCGSAFVAKLKRVRFTKEIEELLHVGGVHHIENAKQIFSNSSFPLFPSGRIFSKRRRVEC